MEYFAAGISWSTSQYCIRKTTKSFQGNEEAIIWGIPWFLLVSPNPTPHLIYQLLAGWLFSVTRKASHLECCWWRWSQPLVGLFFLQCVSAFYYVLLFLLIIIKYIWIKKTLSLNMMKLEVLQNWCIQLGFKMEFTEKLQMALMVVRVRIWRYTS